MFRRSRMKIVAAIMAVLVGLFAGTLCVIYFSSYYEVYHKDRKMLELYADGYWKSNTAFDSTTSVDSSADTGHLEIQTPPQEQAPEDSILPEFYDSSVLTFYAVAKDEDGTETVVNKEDSSGISEEKLLELAGRIFDETKANGMYDQWVYHRETSNGVMLVVVMDNTVLQESVKTLAQYTLIFGGIAVLLIFIVALDLSKRIVRPLEVTFKKQKQYLSDAGHELKTPLAVIQTNVDMLEREVGKSKWLENIRYENKRMTELVHQLLILARTENVEPEKNKIDVSHLVTGDILPFESIAFEKGTVINTEIQKSLFLMGNKEQIQNLVSILMDNAIEHSVEKSSIDVTLKEEKNNITLTVTNEGQPVSQEQMELIFERFYRADKARTSSGQGHYGLGLSIAKAIVTAHKGEILASYSDGKMTFKVILPKDS